MFTKKKKVLHKPPPSLPSHLFPLCTLAPAFPTRPLTQRHKSRPLLDEGKRLGGAAGKRCFSSFLVVFFWGVFIFSSGVCLGLSSVSLELKGFLFGRSDWGFWMLLEVWLVLGGLMFKKCGSVILSQEEGKDWGYLDLGPPAESHKTQPRRECGARYAK